MQKSCKNCSANFTIEPDDLGFYEKMQVPPPTQCPECRLIRRLARRNERTFHRRICEKCSKPTLSVFAEASGIHVYCRPCWWSDSWDGMDYGVDYDPSRPFLDQLDELFHHVPIQALYGLYATLENSDYTNMVGWLKNCYMVTYSDYGENLVHGSFVNYSKDSVDNLMGLNLELCYETINCTQCYQTFFSVDCDGCNNVWYSKNCSGCTNCYGCVNLRNKSYHIFNEPYTKEEYEKKIKTITQEEAEKFWTQHPQKFMHGFNNENVLGDYLTDCKNAFHCFDSSNLWDCTYVFQAFNPLKTAMDIHECGDAERLYECANLGYNAYNMLFSMFGLADATDLLYCLNCPHCKNWGLVTFLVDES